MHIKRLGDAEDGKKTGYDAGGPKNRVLEFRDMLSTDAATAFDNIGTDVEDNSSAQTPYSLADAADRTNDGSNETRERIELPEVAYRQRRKEGKKNRLNTDAQNIGKTQMIKIDVRIEFATTSDYALPESTFKRNKD